MMKYTMCARLTVCWLSWRSFNLNSGHSPLQAQEAEVGFPFCSIGSV